MSGVPRLGGATGIPRCSPPESVTLRDSSDRRSRTPKAGDWAGHRRYDRATRALRAARERMDVHRAALEGERSALPRLIREGLDAGLSLRAVGKLLGMSYETVRRLRSRPGA